MKMEVLGFPKYLKNICNFDFKIEIKKGKVGETFPFFLFAHFEFYIKKVFKYIQAKLINQKKYFDCF